VSVGSIAAAAGLTLFGYLMGSLSPSVWLGKALKGVDLREHGSGNAGSSNAFRILGKRVGVAVLVCDVLKGVIPVVLARYFSTPVVTVVVAFASVIGHTYSIFLKGRGGKGVATGAGAAVAMIPVPMACLMGLFVLLLLTTRIVSIASITSTLVLPVLAGLLYHYRATGVWATPLPYMVACCLMAAIVLWAHRTNVKRVLQGTERKVVFPWNKKSDRQAAASGPATEAQSQ
jgi:glycerol-3-phosphate acyltransferase PlsY